MKIGIIFSCFLLFAFDANASDYKADKDFIVVTWIVEHCAENLKEYNKPNASESTKKACANYANQQLFILWLMYFGPWKFDISDNESVKKYIINVKAKYRDIANKASLRDDPINILSMFDEKGSHVAERLPDGFVPNLDTKSIRTKEDYRKLVLDFHDWLNEPIHAKGK